MKKKLFIYLWITIIVSTANAQSPTFQWAKKVGASGPDWCLAIITDPSSNVYSTGYFNASVDFDPGPAIYTLICGSSNWDPFVTKLDSAGNFLWAKQFKGTAIHGGKGLSIKLDNSDNVYVTGEFFSTVDFDPGPAVYNLTTGTTDLESFVVKLDSAGNFLWARQFKGSGNNINSANSLNVDPAGNAIVTGIFNQTVDFDPGTGITNMTALGPGDMYVVKLSSSGDLVWAKQVAGTGGIYGRSMNMDGSGNIIITGNFQGVADFDTGAGVYNLTSSSTNGDIFICKLTPSGNLSWVKTIAAYKSTSLTVNRYDDVTIAGEFRDIVDFDPGPGVFNLNAPEAGGFVCKLDKNGIFINAAAVSMGPPAPNLQFFLNSIDNDAAGNVYVAGAFMGTIDFDPGPGTYYVTSNFRRLSFVFKLTYNGDFVWAVVQQTTVNFTQSNFLTIDTLKNIYCTGEFGSNITFNAGPNAVTLTGGFEDIFLYKMSQCNTRTYFYLTETACNSYVLNGHTYTSTGIYTQVLNNYQGCDSIITLDLFIGGSNDTSAVITCDSYTWQGQTYTSSGFYRDTLVSSTNCDSILNLNLTINYKVFSTVAVTICQGQVYAGHSTTGSYVDTYPAANGCDSIRTLNLTVSPKLFSSITTTICEGQNYGGHSIGGIYVDTLISTFGCDSIRTLDLTVNPRAFTPILASICEGQTYYAGGANQTTSGIYKDTLLTSLGCDSVITTTLLVNSKPKPDLGPDGNLCTNSQGNITPGIFNNYLWQDNSTQPNYTVSNPGTYWVRVTDANNCSATDTLNIISIDTIPQNFLPPNQELCYGNVLRITVPDYFTYQWSTGSTGDFIDINTFGTFYLTVKDWNLCTGTDSISIQRKNCINIGIPNAFTPNGDSKNDIFKPTIFQAVKNFSFIVFNRYGEKVFETFDYGRGWDGTYKGKGQATGSYIYRIKFTNIFGWESVENGSVLLIR
ncbi:MAG: gliding motility-associated C-terminal domain-containing protein [Ferruginibacter sp.]